MGSCNFSRLRRLQLREAFLLFARLMARAAPHTAGPWPRRFGAVLLGTYATRFMVSLAAALLLVGLCFHLPLHSFYNAVGWQISTMQRPMLDVVDVRTEVRETPASGVPVTRFGTADDDVSEGDEDDTSEPEDLPSPPPPATKMELRQAVLDFAEQQPHIVGGLGAYYIHIQYPEEAVRKGIEGRLMLTFVVNTDGKPSEIEIIRSLHASCDSAAVQALRQTRFVPGKQNGEAVRVRMRLPVRFKLVSPGAPPDTTDAPPTASSQM